MTWDDLLDWIIEHNIKVYEATRYLTVNSQYDCWLTIYNKQCKGQ